MTGLVIGKFDPLHEGHKFLLNYASSMTNGNLIVVICQESDDDVPVEIRQKAIQNSIKTKEILIVNYDDEPVYNSPEFFPYWEKKLKLVIREKISTVFAGEPYGSHLAKWFDAEFNPLPRGGFEISATKIKENLDYYWHYLDIEMRRYLFKSFAFIGPESTGKTTLLQKIKETGIRAYYIEEHARHYLDFAGTEVTPDKMETIVRSQNCFTEIIENDPKHAFAFYDTTGLTTIGYSILYNMPTKTPIVLPKVNKYFILDTETVPFVQDPQRYGGNKRETGVDFWASLCEKLEVEYEVLKHRNEEEIIDWVRAL